MNEAKSVGGIARKVISGKSKSSASENRDLQQEIVTLQAQLKEAEIAKIRAEAQTELYQQLGYGNAIMTKTLGDTLARNHAFNTKASAGVDGSSDEAVCGSRTVVGQNLKVSTRASASDVCDVIESDVDAALRQINDALSSLTFAHSTLFNNLQSVLHDQDPSVTDEDVCDTLSSSALVRQLRSIKHSIYSLTSDARLINDRLTINN